MPASPLLLDGWQKFNEYKWNLRPLQISLSKETNAQPSIRAVIYLNKNGKICLPPLDEYMPVEFTHTPTSSPASIHRQWQEVASLLVNEMKKHGIFGRILFSPEVTDIRPWQWENFQTGVRHTLLIDLPLNEKKVTRSVIRKVNKAMKDGFTCRKGGKLDDVIACLRETEQRSQFSYDLSKEDIERAQELMGVEAFRVYCSYTASGEPASSRLVLCSPSGMAIDWVAGTKTNHLSSGCTQLLVKFILDDLAASKVTVFDFGGAGIPQVAAMKSDWGGRLVHLFCVESPTAKGLWKYFKQWVRH